MFARAVYFLCMFGNLNFPPKIVSMVTTFCQKLYPGQRKQYCKYEVSRPENDKDNSISLFFIHKMAVCIINPNKIMSYYKPNVFSS